ncbi:hypothetical protein VTO73DRAFT_372 [Trametes versicolor]
MYPVSALSTASHAPTTRPCTTGPALSPAGPVCTPRARSAGAEKLRRTAAEECGGSSLLREARDLDPPVPAAAALDCTFRHKDHLAIPLGQHFHRSGSSDISSTSAPFCRHLRPKAAMFLPQPDTIAYRKRNNTPLNLEARTRPDLLSSVAQTQAHETYRIYHPIIATTPNRGSRGQTATRCTLAWPPSMWPWQAFVHRGPAGRRMGIEGDARWSTVLCAEHATSP